MKDFFSASRPLSPHLQVYRFPLTVVLSILHRFSGVVLAVAYVAFVALLFAAAFAGDSYLWLQAILGGLFGKLLLFFVTVSLYFHLCTGVRHLFWDVGVGFDLRTVDRTAYIALLVAFLLTALTWAIYFMTDG